MSEIYKGNDPVIEEPILNVKVKQGDSIGYLPRLSLPLIKINNETYTPYIPAGWFKHPSKQADMQVHDYDPYWTDRDTIIYAVYDTTIYNVFYITDIDTELPPQRVPYDAEVYQPTLKREGYKFGGWINTKTGKDFGGRMPPYDVTLQAKWSKI
jgi:uncharacterized repeat protein (TIGR02543 family)